MIVEGHPADMTVLGDVVDGDLGDWLVQQKMLQ
jgi:hypothetical protein